MKIRDILKSDQLTVSFEVFPPKKASSFETVRSATEGIAALHPSFMSVTYGVGGGTSNYTIDIAKNIQEKYQVPMMAHLTCISSTREIVRQQIEKIHDAGIENVMALRGDIPADMTDEDRSKWDYQHAVQLIRELKESGYDFCIGGACYPEVHPESSSSLEDIMHLKEKVEAGVDFLTTQMVFDNDLFFHFLYQLRDRGVTVPVIPGIMPITNSTQIYKAIRMSSAFIPRRFKTVSDRFGDDPEAYMEVRKERAKAYNNARIYISDEYSIHEYIKDNTDDDYYGKNESSSTQGYINLLNQLDEEFDARVIDGYYTMRSGNEDYDYSDDFSIVLIKYNGYWTPLTTIVTGIIFADYSRKADDVTAAGTVLTGVQTAMADEDCYSEIAGISWNVDREVQVLSVKGGNKNTVDIEYAAGPNVEAELRSTLASGCPIKYTKNDAKYFNVFVNGEALSVYISPYYNGTDWQIWPDTDPEYR